MRFCNTLLAAFSIRYSFYIFIYRVLLPYRIYMYIVDSWTESSNKQQQSYSVFGVFIAVCLFLLFFHKYFLVGCIFFSFANVYYVISARTHMYTQKQLLQHSCCMDCIIANAINAVQSILDWCSSGKILYIIPCRIYTQNNKIGTKHFKKNQKSKKKISFVRLLFVCIQQD